jgi:hypothetical protein
VRQLGGHIDFAIATPQERKNLSLSGNPVPGHFPIGTTRLVLSQQILLSEDLSDKKYNGNPQAA